ncbi:MAG TPA: TonB-dependent receptor [Gammaproteobacteria bacterium]|nr:TonB-dependent receptor [Gammaproteobacteria bacterium]
MSSVGSRESSHRRSIISAAIALGLTAGPLVGAAQESPGDEIVVHGYRSSLNASLSAKRESDGAVDVIVAEDIADFPDLNLAEALQRIPGVAISRAGGEGRQVTVRGLGPTFTTTRINGMEALSTGGFTDALGGQNRTRGFDFNAFDSELFTRLAVRKTSSAEIEEGGLGATLDLRTARPFDYDGFTIATSAQLGYNDRSEESDPRAAFQISNTFADDKFGALLSLSWSERNTLDEGSSTVRWSDTENFGSVNGVPGQPATHEVNTAFHPRLPRYDSYVQNTERFGVAGALQFRPSEATSLDLDVLFSQADTTRDEAFIQAALNNTGFVTATNISNYSIRDAAIVSATLTNATLLSERRHDELAVDFDQTVLSFRHDFNDRFGVNALIGSANSEFDNPVQRYVILQKNGDFSYDMNGADGAVFTWGPQAQDPNGWIVSNLRKREPYVLNELDVGELTFAFRFNDLLTLNAGVTSKTYNLDTTQAFMANEANNGVNGVMDPSLLVTYDGGTLGSWAAPNLDAFDAQYGFYADGGVFLTSTDFRLQDTFTVEEKTDSAFVQLEFAFGDRLPVRGNVGVRSFETDQNSTGIASLAVGTISADVTYSDTLPSLNIVFELTDELLLRFGYAEVINRPGMMALRPVASVTVTGSNRTVNGNNPGLGPTLADTYDLSAEWYFAEESVLALALFQKDIGSFVQTIVQNVPYTETGLPLQQAIDACNTNVGYGPNCNENLPWNVNAPGNSPGGDVKGYELSYQQPFSFFDGFARNFGLMANYTYVDSKIDYLGVTGTPPVTTVVRPDESLTNLSKNMANLTFYFENDKLGARISLAERDDYLTMVPGRNGTYVERTEGTTNIDFSANFNFNDNLKLTFEALNLTDESENQRLDATILPANVVSYFHETGRQFFVGLRYTL